MSLNNSQYINVNQMIYKYNHKGIFNNIIRFAFIEKEDDVIKKNFGTGFLCKIFIDEEKSMPVLISSNHLLKENNSKYKNNLEFSYYPEFSHSKNGHKKRIDLSSPRIIYQNKNLDITIIEIIEEDNLDIYSFLEMDNSINTDNPIMLYKKIYILHYPLENKEENYSQGKIIHIFNDNINFFGDYSTEEGSSGSPIINFDNDCVIGIHLGKLKNYDIPFGLLLKYAIKKFIEENKEKIKSSYKNLYEHTDTMELIYSIPKNKEIAIVGEDFQKKYKNKCKIIYNGKEYPLTEKLMSEYITEEDEKRGKIKIILKGIRSVKDMSYMFQYCVNLIKVNATRTDMSNIESMEAMFEWCLNLKEITDMSQWNLENVKTIRGLFYMCKRLKKLPGIDKWNLTKMNNCEELFLGCRGLDPSELTKIEKWKNFSDELKVKAFKGITVENYITYALIDNVYYTLNYFFGRVSTFFVRNFRN